MPQWSVHGVDVSLFHWINQWPEWLAPIFVFFSEATKTTVGRVLLLAFVIAMLAGKQTRKALLIALIAWPIANGVTDVLKATFQMTRPCVALWPDVVMRVKVLTSFGTASAHSANMAAVATVLGYYLKPWGYFWIGIALLTGLSRIYVGVHYPSQVLLGWTVGFLVALLVIKTWEGIAKRRNSVSREGDGESTAAANQP